MKVKVDNALPVSLLGTQTPQPDSVRYYYKVVGYDCLLLCCHDYSYPELVGKTRVALWNLDGIDNQIVCDLFPNAPDSWRDEDKVIYQVTLRELNRMGSKRPLWLSDEVANKLGASC